MISFAVIFYIHSNSVWYCRCFVFKRICIFYCLLSKSTEVCERNANIEIERIYILPNGEYEYETIERLREEKEEKEDED